MSADLSEMFYLECRKHVLLFILTPVSALQYCVLALHCPSFSQLVQLTLYLLHHPWSNLWLRVLLGAQWLQLMNRPHTIIPWLCAAETPIII